MKTNRKINNICVLGCGLWGTVLADHLARQGHAVRAWDVFPELAERLEETRSHPHLPDLRLARSVHVTSDMAEATRNAGMVLVVLPSAHVRATARRLRQALGAAARQTWAVSASKGVEPVTLLTMGDILADEVPGLDGRVYTLSGPSFAREVARGVHTSLVLAGPLGAAERLRELFLGGPLHVSACGDRRGVELGGSLKNVVAVGCGMLDGMGVGANTKAAFMTQGLAEMARIVAAYGGRRETAYGLSGIGDLIATGTSPESRNRGLGERLGAGMSLADAMREIPTVMEGVESSRSALALARAKSVRVPLMTAIWRVLHRGAPPRTILTAMGFDGPRSRPRDSQPRS